MVLTVLDTVGCYLQFGATQLEVEEGGCAARHENRLFGSHRAIVFRACGAQSLPKWGRSCESVVGEWGPLMLACSFDRVDSHELPHRRHLPVGGDS